jgi:primosomal protein N' (replication factor Y)
VGVLDADVALHLPDFRAAERTFQLLTQVAGRSGRGAHSGEVFVQTCTPEHPAIAAAVRGDAHAFLERELAERREAGYPPFRRLAALLFTGTGEAAVERAATDAAESIAPDARRLAIEVLGPAPQALARLRGRHRWHLLFKGTHAGRLCEVARLALERAEAHPDARTVRAAVDVDPVEVL